MPYFLHLSLYLDFGVHTEHFLLSSVFLSVIPRCQMKRVHQQTCVCLSFVYILFSTANSRSLFVRTRFSFSVFRHVVVSAQDFAKYMYFYSPPLRIYE